jgi:hypothetical protein
MIYPLHPATPILDGIPNPPEELRPLPIRLRSWACLAGDAERCDGRGCGCVCHAQPSTAWPAAFDVAAANVELRLSRPVVTVRPIGPALADLIATRTRRSVVV